MSSTLWDLTLFFNIILDFTENNLWIFLKTIRHIEGNVIHECVHFGADTNKKSASSPFKGGLIRALFGLGGGMHPIECYCSYLLSGGRTVQRSRSIQRFSDWRAGFINAKLKHWSISLFLRCASENTERQTRCGTSHLCGYYQYLEPFTF